MLQPWKEGESKPEIPASFASWDMTRTTSQRRFPTSQQALILLIIGVVIGYPSFENLSIWGGSVSRYQALYVMGFFAGALAFISGLAAFLALTVRALTSPTASDPSTMPRPRAATGATSRASVASPPATVHSSAAPVLIPVHTTLAAGIALACIVLWLTGGPPVTSSYGRAYWLNAALALLLGQLPYAVALIRTWNVADRAGLALAIAASATQILLMVITKLQQQ